jgi:hypothetical protein
MAAKKTSEEVKWPVQSRCQQRVFLCALPSSESSLNRLNAKLSFTRIVRRQDDPQPPVGFVLASRRLSALLFGRRDPRHADASQTESTQRQFEKPGEPLVTGRLPSWERPQGHREALAGD